MCYVYHGLLTPTLQAGEAAAVVIRTIAASTEAETKALGVLSGSGLEVASLLTGQSEHIRESKLSVGVVAAADCGQAATFCTSDGRSADTALALAIAETNLLADIGGSITLGSPVDHTLADVAVLNEPLADSRSCGLLNIFADTRATLADSLGSGFDEGANQGIASTAPYVTELCDFCG